ncbi:MAG: hypothetical protein MSL80_03430 [Helicobacter sp.]|uniref:hypothetical protein n=1 Tax=Helicobacter sp. TaxID=218 RepID=UPI0037510323|nr:hypothetical protein [Helicobacter sp.]
MKTRKVALSLAFMAMFSSLIYAETADEENARLKKENELLELQQKNANLKNNKSKNESVQSSNIDKSGFLGFCRGEYANTGCFIGAEVGYAPSVKNYLVDHTGSVTQNTYALPINLILGWQVYSAKNWGWNFKAFFGYAGYSSDITFDGISAKFNSSALHYGIEASYLYDFIISQQHTFGMNVGIGYEFGTFIGQSVDIGVVKVSLDSYTKTSFISSIGVHYFLNVNHQFWLTYKYKSGYNVGDGGSMNVGGIQVKHSSTPNNVLTFAYAYKF